MSDVLTPEQRRKNMQNIPHENTKIEVLLRKALWRKGYRFRRNYKALPGKPDIVFTKYKIAIFAMENFFMEKTGKCLDPNWRKVITASFGSVKYLEIESEMMK